MNTFPSVASSTLPGKKSKGTMSGVLKLPVRHPTLPPPSPLKLTRRKNDYKQYTPQISFKSKYKQAYTSLNRRRHKNRGFKMIAKERCFSLNRIKLVYGQLKMFA